MTFVLVAKLLRDIRLPLLVISMLLIGFGALWVKVTERVTTQLAPLFQSLAVAFGMRRSFFQEVLFDGPAKFFQTALGGEATRFDRAQDMLSVGYLHPFILTICCIWAVGRAASAIAGEIDRGTMELLLAQPLARAKLVLAHLLVDLIVIPTLALSLWVGSAIGVGILTPFTPDTKVLDELGIQAVAIEQPPVSAVQLLPGLINVMGLMFAVSGMTIALSARGRQRWRIIGMAIIMILMMFLVNVLGQMWDAIGMFRPFSVFYYYQPQKIVLQNSWSVDLGTVWNAGQPWWRVNVIIVLLSVGLLGYLSAWCSLNRRDIPAPL